MQKSHHSKEIRAQIVHAVLAHESTSDRKERQAIRQELKRAASDCAFRLEKAKKFAPGFRAVAHEVLQDFRNAVSLLDG